jgi:hypothetical protein
MKFQNKLNMSKTNASEYLNSPRLSIFYNQLGIRDQKF